MTPDTVAGDPLWQKIAAGIALLFLLWHMRDGYRNGMGRKLFGLLALVAAWASAFFFNGLLAKVLQPMIPYPVLLVRALSGVLIAFAVYAVVKGLRGIFFPFDEEKTEGASSRLGGLAAGLLVGLVWICVAWIAVRFVGTFAQCAMQGKPQPIEESYREHPHIATLIKFKDSLDLGEAGVIAQKVDPVPDSFYRLSEKGMRLISNPEACRALAQNPQVKPLLENPKVLALTEDAEVAQLVRERNFHTLLTNEKLRAVADDPELQQQVMAIDFEAAIDQALAQGAMANVGKDNGQSTAEAYAEKQSTAAVSTPGGTL